MRRTGPTRAREDALVLLRGLEDRPTSRAAIGQLCTRREVCVWRARVVAARPLPLSCHHKQSTIEHRCVGQTYRGAELDVCSMVNLTWIGWSAVLYSTRFSERAVGCRGVRYPKTRRTNSMQRGASPLCVRAEATPDGRRSARVAYSRDASARQHRTGKGMRWARIHIEQRVVEDHTVSLSLPRLATHSSARREGYRYSYRSRAATGQHSRQHGPSCGSPPHAPLI